MTGTPASLPARTTLKGGFDAYCHVCWYPIYAMWLDENDDPAGKCMFGCTKATDYSEAVARAKQEARIIQWRKEGVVV